VVHTGLGISESPISKITEKGLASVSSDRVPVKCETLSSSSSAVEKTEKRKGE
jgi:hypothetical protein